MTDHTDVVARIKDELTARGVSVAGPCGAFEITRRALWEHRDEGWGYVAAPAGGENCTGFRTDKGVRPGGTFVDCLVDAGGANTPAWQVRAATPAEIEAYRPLVDPGPLPGTAPAPAPIDAPGPAAPPDAPPAAPPASAPPDVGTVAVDVLAELHALASRLDAVAAGEGTLADAITHTQATIAALQAGGVRIHF